MITIYEYVEAKNPFALVYLIWKGWLTWSPHPAPRGVEPGTIVIDGHPYRDVTEETTAAAAGAGAPPGHDAYRRHRGALRQVRWG
ncbi:MAG: hypothetical protein QME79_14455 [Bacillota bacterium]|nr:hypothetical protein [Bacillota bacterium]